MHTFSLPTEQWYDYLRNEQLLAQQAIASSQVQATPIFRNTLRQ